MRPPKLTNEQKEKLRILEPQLKNAISDRNYDLSGNLMRELQNLLIPTGHHTRFAQYENSFFELALELNNIFTATRGFEKIRKNVSKNTRLYLEASTLLAICHLRNQDIESAKPIIKEVLENDKIIQSPRTRAKFRSEIIERFNQEATLYSLKGKKEEFTENELEKEIISLLQNNSSENDIYLFLGKSVPKETKKLLFQVHNYSTKQLPNAERFALPSPEEKTEEQEIGKTVFGSIKRVIYNSLCNPKSDIYKAWFTNGTPSLVLNKGYIRTAILSSLVNIGISIKMIVAYVVTLVLKFGLEVYCEHYKPKNLMELRGK